MHLYRGRPQNQAGHGYNFKGTALLTPKNAGGDGRLDGPQSFIKSPEFTFKSDSYSGSKATLSMKSAEANKPALTANDVAFDYDLKKGYADFKREEGSKASIDLPYSAVQNHAQRRALGLQEKAGAAARGRRAPTPPSRTSTPPTPSSRA